MILSTHATAGAAAALLIPQHPLIGFAAGFASHFALDAIPHWHYRLRSLDRTAERPLEDRLRFDKDFVRDLMVMGSECLAGVAFAVLAARAANPAYAISALTGAIGGVFPDFLQFVFHLFPNSPVREIQVFHKWIHAKRRRDASFATGLGAEVLISALSLVAIYALALRP